MLTKLLFFIYILHSCAEKYSSIHDQQKQQCNKCFEYRCIMYRNTWKETKLTQNIFLKNPQEIKMRNVHRPMLATPSVEIYIYKNIAHSTIEIFSPMNIAYIITKIISLPWLLFFSYQVYFNYLLCKSGRFFSFLLITEWLCISDSTRVNRVCKVCKYCKTGVVFATDMTKYMHQILNKSSEIC